MVQKNIIKLPPASGITGRSSNPYKEYYVLKKHSKDFRKYIQKQFVKQGGLCYYCLIDLKTIKQNIEHVTPKSKGGNNSGDNLVISCWKCNKEKGSKILSKHTLSRLKKEHTNRMKINRKNRRSELKYQEYLGYKLGRII